MIRIFKCFIFFIGTCLSGLCPSKDLRRKIRDKFDLSRKNSTRSLFIKHKKAGKIYLPLYPNAFEPKRKLMDIYNKSGTRMDRYFIRTKNALVDSNYFIWDYYNYNLPEHFYTQECMLETFGKPDKRYGLFIEAESIIPSVYKIFEKNKGLEKDFDLIFTHTECFLEKYDNARLVPYCANFWYSFKDTNSNNIVPPPIPDWYSLKNKNISIVSSAKTMCSLHHLRIEWAKQCKKNGWADTFGDFDGGELIPIEKSLKNYRFSIAIENQVEPYWFTEKIVNCFASMTIPIYIGATKIDKFFNPDGIIQVHPKDYDNLENIIKICTKEYYDERIDIVLENYYKSLQFENINDFMYLNYLKKQ